METGERMEIHFEIGDRCMLKCRHCSSMASEAGDVMKYSEQDMTRLLKSINGPKEVFLTGGEPLLYENLEALLEYLQEETEDIKLGLFTTGIIANKEKDIKSISEEYASTLAKSGLKVCYVSVYSHLEKEHDWMTVSPGSFKLLIESIKHLQKAGVEIRFNCVVTKKNMESFVELIKLAETMDVAEVRMLKLIKQGRAEECWEEIGITESQYRKVILDVMQRQNRIRITASGAVDILPCRQAGGTECPAGKGLIYVTNEGELYPCASVKRKEKYRIANITESDIDKKREVFLEHMPGTMLCC